MERQLINYLPEFMQKYAEIQEIMSTEQETISCLWDNCNSVMDGQFISTAGKEAIERYERMLGIAPKNTYTLDERRYNIIIALNEQLPYSEYVIKKQLSIWCGESNYMFIVTPNTYSIKCKIGVDNAANYESIARWLRCVCPANMLIDVEIMYNSNEYLSQFPLFVLMWFTHEEIRCLHIEENLDKSVGNIQKYKVSDFETRTVSETDTWGRRIKK